MIYTTNFNKVIKNPTIYKGKELIGIVRIVPQQVIPRVTYDTALAPPRKLLKAFKSKEITEEQYTEAYVKILDSIGVHNIKNEYNNKVLLCYCRENDFCHRHLLRGWLANHNILAKEI